MDVLLEQKRFTITCMTWREEELPLTLPFLNPEAIITATSTWLIIEETIQWKYIINLINPLHKDCMK